MCGPRPSARAVRVPHETALHVGQAAQHGDHQAAGAGAGIGPRLGQRAELPAGIHNALHDGKEVEGRARQAVYPRHRHNVAGGEILQEALQLASVGSGAAGLLPVDLGASSRTELLELSVERLPVSADSGIAEGAVFWRSFGHIFRDTLAR